MYTSVRTPRILLNGMYAESTVGTGTWTRALSGALGSPSVWKPHFDPTDRRRSRFIRKLAVEYCFRYRDAEVRVHPYWAAAPDARAVVCVLDLIGRQALSPPHRRLLDRAAATARSLITISKKVQSDITAVLGRDAIVTHPHPDREFFVAPSGGRSPGGKVRLGYWGGWDDRKCIREMVDSIRRSSISSGVEVVGVGQSDGNPKAIATSDLVRFVDSIDIALYPSSDEGFGLPVYESLLRGKPIVVQPLPSYDDIVKSPGGSLHFADPRSSRDVARAIAEAWDARSEPDVIHEALWAPTFGGARARLFEEVSRVPGLGVAVQG